MVTEKDLRELGLLAEKLFTFGGECVTLLRCEDTQQREFEALSIDVAARFAFLAELINTLSDDIGTADYSQRGEISQHIVGEAARKYLCPLP